MRVAFDFHPVCLDEQVDHEGAPRLPLAVETVTAVREERIRGEAVSDRSAGAATRSHRLIANEGAHSRKRVEDEIAREQERGKQNRQGQRCGVEPVRNLAEKRLGADKDVPGVPALDAAEIDPEGTEGENTDHEAPGA